MTDTEEQRKLVDVEYPIENQKEPLEVEEELDEKAKLLPVQADIVAEHPSEQALPTKELLGLFYMAMSAFAFSTMSLLVKIASSAAEFSFPSFELVLARSLVQGAGAAFYLAGIRKNPFGPSAWNIRRLLLIRGVAGAVGLGLFYYALTAMPLSDATVIFFTGPPFTALLSFLVLKEPITALDGAALVGCLCAVTLVARPQFIFHDQPSNEDPQRGLGAISALIGAALASIAYVTVRLVSKLSNQVHTMVYVFYFGFISSLLSPIAMFAFQEPKWPNTPQQWLILLAVGILAFIGQILLNRGLQLAPAGPGMIMRNLDIVFAFVFDITVMHHKPQALSYVGATIIILFTGLIALRKWIRNRQSS